tara:strand:+ start:437 stop:700 length:264 start_codon:yes stop_codon:yes gene_type:complete
MPRKRNKGINFEGLRRKCAVTGKVAQVVCRHIELPPSNRAFNPKETRKAHELPGAVVKYYSSREAAESVHGEGSFTNNYKEEDFYKL